VGGFVHQGYAVCSINGLDLVCEHSIELGKQTYGGTRRWLPDNHPYRADAMKDHFDGEVEHRAKPRVVTVDEQLQYAEVYEAWKSAGHWDGTPSGPSKVHGVKKKSIFHLLPYWKVHTFSFACGCWEGNRGICCRPV